MSIAQINARITELKAARRNDKATNYELVEIDAELRQLAHKLVCRMERGL